MRNLPRQSKRAACILLPFLAFPLMFGLYAKFRCCSDWAELATSCMCHSECCISCYYLVFAVKRVDARQIGRLKAEVGRLQVETQNDFAALRIDSFDEVFALHRSTQFCKIIFHFRFPFPG